MDVITGVPDNKQIDTWVWSLPSEIVVATNNIAAIIASWRYYLGLSPIHIIVEKRK